MTNQDEASRSGDPAFSAGVEGVLTILVLAAPGRLEEEAGRPAAGQTGRNLDGILENLHRSDPARFPSPRRDDYPVVNAFAGVLYRKKHGRTMPNEIDIKQPANLARLAGSLRGMKTIVAFSEEAVMAVRSVGLEPDLIGPHPAMQSLNSLYPGRMGEKKWRVSCRYRRFAAALLAADFKREPLVLGE